MGTKGENNSRRYKKEIKKDIKKRAKKIAKKKREEVGDISYGSRVVQRSAADVRRAPAYKPEKIKSGGFAPTFPLFSNANNILDEQMNMQRFIDQGIKRRKQANEFKVLFDQGMAGNIDMSKMSNEMKQQLQEEIDSMKIQEEKNKYIKQIDSVKQQRQKLAEENMRIASANHLTRNDKGEVKILKRKTLKERANQELNGLDDIKEETDLIRKITEKDKIKQNAKDQLKAVQNMFKKHYKNMTEDEKNAELMEAVKNADMAKLRLFKDKYDQEHETINRKIKLIQENHENIKRISEDRKRMKSLKEEIRLMGDKTGELTEKLDRLERIYGHDGELFEQKAHEATEKLVKRSKKLRDTITNLNTYIDDVKEFESGIDQKRAEMIQRANKHIMMDPYFPTEIKDLAERNKLDMKMLSTYISDAQARRYAAFQEYLKQMNIIHSSLCNNDITVANMNEQLKKDLKKLLDPFVDKYNELPDMDFNDDVIEMEKKGFKQKALNRLVEITGKKPEDFYDESQEQAFYRNDSEDDV